jgi:hypothetical protein
VSESNQHRYILTWADDGFEVHGPFPTERHLVAYGNWWQANCGDGSGDDPRWQSLALTDPAAPVKLVTPDPKLWCLDSYARHTPQDYYGVPLGFSDDDEPPLEEVE